MNEECVRGDEVSKPDEVLTDEDECIISTMTTWTTRTLLYRALGTFCPKVCCQPARAVFFHDWGFDPGAVEEYMQFFSAITIHFADPL